MKRTMHYHMNPAATLRCSVQWLPAIAVAFALTLAVTLPAHSQSYTLLYSFQCGPNDGGYPASGLVLDATGNLYGTTAGGGTYNWGTVFELSSQGTETVLHSFDGSPSDGAAPGYGALLRDTAGNLYGTTIAGGSAGVGTVFRLAPNGKETILKNLSPATGYAYSGLVGDTAGNFYGTGYGGHEEYGSVWEVAPHGKLTILYSFTPGKGGENPVGGLVRDSAGNLYGTTLLGGSSGGGTVFVVSPDGGESSYALPKQEGEEPDAGLLRDSAGNLYGTALLGGTSNFGTVFRLSASGTFSALHSFTGSPDGAEPIEGLVRDPSGNFYGTTAAGGTGTCDDELAPGCGTIYEITSKGVESVLYSFSGTPDGENPSGSALLRDSSGNLYGTTYYGGAYGCGTVFEYAP